MSVASEIPKDSPIEFQSRGAIFGIDPQTECFVFGSSNVDGVLGIGDGSELIGRPFYNILGRNVSHALRNAETHQSLTQRRRYIGDLTMSRGMFAFEVFMSNGVLVVEAVPCGGVAMPSALDVLNDVDILSEALLESTSQIESFKRFVSLLKTMSGYHCVALDQFDDEDATLLTSAGLTKLADNPAPFTNQFSYVFDLQAASVFIDLPPGWTNRDFDLSGLKQPNQKDRAELSRAEIASCASIGLWRGEHVWGRIKFFHQQPRFPNRRTHLALAHLAPLIHQRLMNAH
ncbi:MAG: hypothetical protein AAF668_14290 [Pseudomonadota bacterium]